MASSGTILPSISTFSNQKEKYWEDVSWPFYLLTVAFTELHALVFLLSESIFLLVVVLFMYIIHMCVLII